MLGASYSWGAFLGSRRIVMRTKLVVVAGYFGDEWWFGSFAGIERRCLEDLEPKGGPGRKAWAEYVRKAHKGGNLILARLGQIAHR